MKTRKSGMFLRAVAGRTDTRWVARPKKNARAAELLSDVLIRLGICYRSPRGTLRRRHGFNEELAKLLTELNQSTMATEKGRVSRALNYGQSLITIDMLYGIGTLTRIRVDHLYDYLRERILLDDLMALRERHLDELLKEGRPARATTPPASRRHRVV